MAAGIFRSLVFDLDGTLIDSVPDVTASLNRALAEAGRPALSIEQVKRMIGEGARELVERALAATGGEGASRTERVLGRFLDGYIRRPADHTVVYDGVIEVLGAFKAQGVTMGICTNKPKATTFPVLEALGIGDYFAAVSCADTVPHRKPDGRHVLSTLQTMEADPATAAFVGDSETDIAAARDAGIPSVAVTYGYSKVPPNTLGADALIDAFGDLPQALSSLGQRLIGPAS